MTMRPAGWMSLQTEMSPKERSCGVGAGQNPTSRYTLQHRIQGLQPIAAATWGVREHLGFGALPAERRCLAQLKRYRLRDGMGHGACSMGAGVADLQEKGATWVTIEPGKEGHTCG